MPINSLEDAIQDFLRAAEPLLAPEEYARLLAFIVQKNFLVQKYFLRAAELLAPEEYAWSALYLLY